MNERTMKGKGPQDSVIDLKKLFFALLRKWWLIIIVTVVFAAGGYIGTKMLVAPTYMSTFTAYVNNYNIQEKLNYVTNSDLYSRATIAETAASIAKSATVKAQVAERMGLAGYGDIAVGASVDENSAILTVSVVMHDKDNVKECADVFSEVLAEETGRIIEGSSMQIIDTPREPGGRYAPNYKGNAVKIGLIGFVLICLLLIILALMDDTITNPADLEEAYGIPIIGAIPNLSSKGDKYGKGGAYGYEYGYGYGKSTNTKKVEDK